MKKRTKKLSILFLWTLMMLPALSSCDKDSWLNIRPRGQEIPSDVASFKLLIEDTESLEPGYGLDLFMSDDVRTSIYQKEDPNTLFVRAFKWEEYFTNVYEDDPNWNHLYEEISICNVVLKGLWDPKITGEQKEKALVAAEAKVHRAYANFSLVNLYAKQYSSSAATDLGIPLRTSDQLYGDLTRKSVQEVYDQILQDLNEAIGSGALTKAPDRRLKIKSSQAAAYGLLARVYLQMGKYPQALEAADHSLSAYSVLVAYRRLRDAYKNPEVLLYKRFDDYNVGEVFASDDLLALYAEDDMRRDILYNEGYRDFPVSFLGLDEYFWYQGPSTAEMYLIRAECNARAGNLSVATDDLNTLRAKRIRHYQPLAAYTDQAKALAFIKDERRRELVNRGLRLFDLKRYNVFDHADYSIVHLFEENTYTLKPGSPRWVAPIPPRVISFNPEIKQNPR